MFWLRAKNTRSLYMKKLLRGTVANEYSALKTIKIITRIINKHTSVNCMVVVNVR